MTRILYYIPDIVFRSSTPAHLMRVKAAGISANVCNRMFMDGCLSHLWCPENRICYRTPGLTVAEINERFDKVVFPLANVFNVQMVDYLTDLTGIVRACQIPFFVIGAGAQADLHVPPSRFSAKVIAAAHDFVAALREKGGDLTVRGEYTAAVLAKAGFTDVFVSGCPSLYQLGRNLAIRNEPLLDAAIKPVFNGSGRDPNSPLWQALFHRYPESVWVDQGDFLDMFAGGIHAFQKVRSRGLYELVRAKRIFLFGEMPQWRRWLQHEGFNFSFGHRIHGAFNSILAGVPACVWVGDSRTRELCDFFEIPWVEDYDGAPLSRLRDGADYSSFNAHFPARYDRFMNWFRSHGLATGEPDRAAFIHDFYSYPEPPFPQPLDISLWKWAMSRIFRKGKNGRPLIVSEY